MTALPESIAGDQRASSRRGLVGTVLRGGSWQATAQLAPLVVNIVLTPVIIAGLGIDRYGLFLLVNVIALILTAADGGVGAASLRYFAIYAGAGDRAAATRLLVTTVLAISGLAAVAFGMFFALAGSVLSLFRIPPELLDEGTFLLRTLIVITGVAVVRNVFAAVLNAHQRYALTSVTTNLGHVIYVAGVLLTVDQEWGLYGIAITLVVQQVAATLLIVPAACRLLERRSVGFMGRAERREFLRYAMHMQWSSLMLLVTVGSDSIIIGAFLPVRQVAYYQTGASFALQLRNLPLNALPPIQSILGRDVGAAGIDGARPSFEWLQRLWVVGTAGWGVVAMAAAWFGVTAWLGPDFAISGVVAVVVLLGYVFFLWGSVLNVWTQVLGRPELNARSVTLAAAVNLLLTLALIVPFGIIGTVVATAISQVVATLWLLRLSRRRLPGDRIRNFLKDVPLGACLVAATVVVALEILARPIVPDGALGLLTAGVVAAPGLVAFAVTALGPRATWDLLRGRVGAAARTLDGRT